MGRNWGIASRRILRSSENSYHMQSSVRGKNTHGAVGRSSFLFRIGSDILTVRGSTRDCKRLRVRSREKKIYYEAGMLCRRFNGK